ncbi:AlkA N-terminal domain-containing protein [Ottowia sp. SB7-C50]|uniref:AlkA N-terminal domain-containing protein n=1 Tax=Ottowia sp. SB7-C50 TaxID=3081231 RepID=UPI002952E8E5|nr:AlkA N-terminal domain-containing protein [Ottowia sp. SB7-C50]WOP14644.1 AlkA N-terminal domain-containing protein [Ottowia sp. SB7-C50]
MPSPTAPLDADACYRAVAAHDARFDGAFFIGVTSTGIYCRPVCRVKTPRRENCRFFTHASQAEGAGFRPCLRCRPEFAPQTLAWSAQDASALLAQHAARLLDSPDAWGDDVPSVAGLAARLGVSDRHLRRVFEAELGVSPMDWLQTRRLLAAKQLLADTRLPIAQVALAAGFASLRRFNAAFAAQYRMSPTALRRDGSAPAPGDGIVVTLGYRPPYDVREMLQFLQQRGIAGVEQIDVAAHTVARTLRLDDNTCGWVACRFEPDQHRVQVRVAEALAPQLPRVLARVRAWLDLDADPAAIHAVLGADFPTLAGLRVPGTLDGFELAVRAVIGQQVTVAAARTLTRRLVERFGAALATPIDGLARLFPTPAALAAASGDELGQLGLVRQRQAAIQALASAVSSGQLNLHAGVDVAATMDALKTLPGIGDWTADYIALRALRWPDAFPAGDVALQKALSPDGQRLSARAAQSRAERWRPWRAYAVVRAWQSPPTSLSTS